ncbi:MAG: RidA family protein [Actinomycetota bacterium]|nr:RidA family protein [Actinomycetota bacterium]
MSERPHEMFNPETLQPPKGYAHALRAAGGTLVFLGGQTGHDAAGGISTDLVAQFDRACWNVVEALHAAGAEPEHVASMQIYVVDVHEYRSRLKEIGEAYRAHFGKHYPAMALLGTTQLFDPRARVELVGVAVIP